MLILHSQKYSIVDFVILKIHVLKKIRVQMCLAGEYCACHRLQKCYTCFRFVSKYVINDKLCLSSSNNYRVRLLTFFSSNAYFVNGNTQLMSDLTYNQLYPSVERIWLYIRLNNASLSVPAIDLQKMQILAKKNHVFR